MGWDHNSVYDALLKKGKYEKKGKVDKYVSLDQQKLRSLNSILYRIDSRYVKAPVHINKKRPSFSGALFRKIEPALNFKSPGGQDWGQYSIIDWGKFAKGLGLEINSNGQSQKTVLKKTSQEYKLVKEICIQCFKAIGPDSSFKKTGNVIQCMKEKAGNDWPKDWIDYVEKNAGSIIKGVEIKK
jgi:hypothetical protein